ncbi:MAG: hypothetical protein RLY86_2937 [Pseudomonadota bacterium]
MTTLTAAAHTVSPSADTARPVLAGLVESLPALAACLVMVLTLGALF